MGFLSGATEYRRRLKAVAIAGLRRDLHRVGATEDTIAAAERELHAALAQVTAEANPGPTDYAEEVAMVAIRVTARYAPPHGSD